MFPVFERKLYLMIPVIFSILSGFLIYYLLSSVLVTQRITIMIAIIISVLVFGLIRYYSTSVSYNDRQSKQSRDMQTKGSTDNTLSHKNKNEQNEIVSSDSQSLSIILIVAIYAIAIVISTFSEPDLNIFTSWEKLDLLNLIHLGFSILLAFFLPGYALLVVLSKGYIVNAILRVILAYLFSILITGLTTYILGTTFDTSVLQIKESLIGIHLTILAGLVIYHYSAKRNRIGTNFIIQNKRQKYEALIARSKLQLILKFSIIKERTPEILVFGSLFALLIVSTYYLYGGITLGDQWFHQGRAISVISGNFRQVALSGAESYYPPFQSTLIAGITTLSGTPLANTYASIAFLNILPLFSFYYFFSRWVPTNMQRAGLIASTLFMISSGFGWVYLTNMMTTANPMDSESSAIDAIFNVRSYILMPTNFVVASHPDFNTALTYIALPAGLVLMGLSRQIFQNTFAYTIIVTVISVIGIISHEEFYFFIIVVSILLVIFRIKDAKYVYLGILFAHTVVYLLNTVAPLNYYTFNQIFGIPLLYLSTLFVSLTWMLYTLVQNIHKLIDVIPWVRQSTSKNAGILFSLDSLIGTIKRKKKARIGIGIFGSFLVMCVFVSSAVNIASISVDDANDKALNGIVPWYQYPMKLGVAGVLGSAFIVSFLFRRFEKEIFVFGIIILIALLTGPYYDQHRFSKYVMMGFTGFAALLVYKILLRLRYKPIANEALITIVIVTASLSTLLFVGYNSLAFQNHDYQHDLGRRNFPTESELNLLDAIRTNADFDSQRYNVLSTPDEYNFFKGTILTKVSDFSGVPTDKLLQGRFVLNVTTLDALYRLLDYSDTRFIIIPREDINNEHRLTQPVRFALDSFRHFYENEEYVVLEVPHLTSPSSYSGGETDVALVLKQKESRPESDGSAMRVLEYNNETFNSDQLNKTGKFDNNNNNNQQGNQNKIQNVVLCGSESKKNQGVTLWSKGLNDIAGAAINSVKVGFRITDVYDDSEWNDAGLRWKQGDKEYYASISKNGLEFYQITVRNDDSGKYDKKLLYQNTGVQKKDAIWYRLKLEALQNSVNVYVDDVLKIRIPSVLLGNTNNSSLVISSVGISCYNNAVDFTPIKVGAIPNPIQDSPVDGVKNNHNYDYDEYYHPLSILALSQSKYDTFIDTDLSALSKKFIVLSFDPVDWNDERFNKYLDYVNEGGTLVVINSDSNLKGRFSQLLSVKSNENTSKIKFTNITGIKNESEILNISGMVKNLQIDPSSNTSIIASYVDNANNKANNKVAPFALEKPYSSHGKIIFVNADGYLKAISKSPKQYFMSLSNVSDILGLKLPKSALGHVSTLPTDQFVGNMDISGNATLKSTSLLLANNAVEGDKIGYANPDNHYSINAQAISIYKDGKLNSTFSNVSIKDLKLYGDYYVNINSTDRLKLPYMTSQHNYIGVSIPSKFNMTVQLSSEPVTSAKIVIQDKKNPTSVDTVEVNSDSEIRFYNIQTRFSPQESSSGSRSTITPILLKSPEIDVNGHTKFTMLRFAWHYLENVHFEVQGLKTRLDFVDDYSQPHGNGTKIEYITYVLNNTLTGGKE